MQSYDGSNFLNYVKRNLLTLTILICIPTLTACGPTQTDSQGNETTVPESNTDVSAANLDQTEINIDNDITSTDTETIETETEESHSLSKDAQDIETIATHFVSAYFSGDSEKLKEFLVTPYEWSIDTYPDPQNAPDLSSVVLKGISDITEKNIDDTCVVYAQYKDNSSSDYIVSLTMGFIKKEDGWKIQFYGLEL
ncbi:hypothetical protein SAMN02745687_02184 [Lachnospiraceae bacterium NK3A20]|nr:hypothetical protein SAMN02745687_02184 [Lachnospiraceae bacterium NK3A20]